MSETKLSSAEAELYDRQIRLWGIESQEKLRAANVLLIKIRGLGSEIAKDILLSGINSLHIVDDGVVEPEDVLKNFLLEQDSIGKNIVNGVLVKAQALNPLVKIVTDTDPIEKKDDKFFAKFTIVVGTGLGSKQLLRISKVCRENNVKFISGDNFGTFGCTIADFQEHVFYEDKVKISFPKKRTREGEIIKSKPKRTTVKTIGKMKYPDLSEVITLPTDQVKAKRRNIYYYLLLALLQFRDKMNRDPKISSKESDIKELKAIKDQILELYQVNSEKFNEAVFDLIFEEIVPVCSIVGGVIVQEVIKAVSGKEVPICNVFLLDPFTFAGTEESLGEIDISKHEVE